MTDTVTGLIIRMLLSLSMIYAAPVYAVEQSATPQTQTGGGGGIPPETPKTKLRYWGEKRPGPSGRSQRSDLNQPRVGRLEKEFGRRNLLDSFKLQNETIYFEGRRSSMGEYVFRPEGDPGQVREGTMMAGTRNIVWDHALKSMNQLVSELSKIDLKEMQPITSKRERFRYRLAQLKELSRETESGRRFYPGYDEVDSSRTPLPKNKSLVPVTGVEDRTHDRVNRDPRNEDVEKRNRAIEEFNEKREIQFRTELNAIAGGGGRVPPKTPRGLKYSPGPQDFAPKNLMDSAYVKGQTIYFEGREKLGHELVFRPDTVDGKLSLSVLHEGLYVNGKVLWFKNTKSIDALIRELNTLDLSKTRFSEVQKAQFREQLRRLSEWAQPKVETKWPAYPEAPSDKSPIPSDHALVPQGPVESKSPNRGYQDPIPVAAENPSALQKRLEWNDQKAAELRKMFDQIRQGRQWFDQGEVKKDVDPNGKSGIAHFTEGAVAFYLALGVAAKFTLMVDYANNPMAWDDYLNQLTDPVGWMALAGFMAGGSIFYNRVGATTGATGSPLRTVPLFAAGLFAGAVAGMATEYVAQYYTDPDVYKCNGFGNFEKTGKFQRDMAACDRAYKKWSLYNEQNGGLAVDFVSHLIPLTANLMIGAGIYSMGEWALNQLAIYRGLRMIAVSKTPKGGLVGLGMMVGQIGLFYGAYYIAKKTFGIEKAWSDFKFTHESLVDSFVLSALTIIPGYGYYAMRELEKLELHPNPAVADLPSAENNLLQAWTDLRHNAWQHPDTDKFNLVLSRYSALLGQWRTNQMQDTMSAYGQWMRKVTEYHYMVDVSHRFYEKTIGTIDQSPALLTEKSYANAFSAVKTTDKSELQLRNEIQALSKKNYDGAWKFVETFRLPDFLLASMACGPEVEGFGPSEGWLGKLTTTVQKYTTANTTPAQMIEDPSGSAISFYPPRVTNPLPGTRDTICQKNPSLIPGPLDLFGRDAAHKFPAAYFPVSTFWTQDLTAYIKENIRKSVLPGDGTDRFEKWWNDYVMNQVAQKDEELRLEYKQMLDGRFKTALTRPDYYWSDVSTQTETGLEQYMQDLAVPGEVAPTALHRLPYGILNSMRDEMQLYLAMLVQLYAANHPKPADNKALTVAQGLMNRFVFVDNQMTVTDPAQRLDFTPLTAGEIVDFRGLQDAVLGDDGVKKDDQALASAILNRVIDLFEGSTVYLKILTSMDGARAH